MEYRHTRELCKAAELHRISVILIYIHTHTQRDIHTHTTDTQNIKKHNYIESRLVVCAVEELTAQSPYRAQEMPEYRNSINTKCNWCSAFIALYSKMDAKYCRWQLGLKPTCLSPTHFSCKILLPINVGGQTKVSRFFAQFTLLCPIKTTTNTH